MQVIDIYPAKRQVPAHAARQTMPLCGSIGRFGSPARMFGRPGARYVVYQ
jgi:hypothetical protein